MTALLHTLLAHPRSLALCTERGGLRALPDLIDLQREAYEAGFTVHVVVFPSEGGIGYGSEVRGRFTGWNVMDDHPDDFLDAVDERSFVIVQDAPLNMYSEDESTSSAIHDRTVPWREAVLKARPAAYVHIDSFGESYAPNHPESVPKFDAVYTVNRDDITALHDKLAIVGAAGDTSIRIAEHLRVCTLTQPRKDIPTVIWNLGWNRVAPPLLAVDKLRELPADVRNILVVTYPELGVPPLAANTTLRDAGFTFTFREAHPTLYKEQRWCNHNGETYHHVERTGALHRREDIRALRVDVDPQFDAVITDGDLLVQSQLRWQDAPFAFDMNSYGYEDTAAVIALRDRTITPKP